MIGNKSAIELGAGNGDLGYHLGITSTDSYCQQKHPLAKTIYTLADQPPTNPSEDVVEMDAIEALDRYRPDIAIASWLTQYSDIPGQGSLLGPREEEILTRVKTYIHIGNEVIHGIKRILGQPHDAYYFPWLVSRASFPSQNVIYVWGDVR